MNILELVDKLSKEEITEALRYLPDLNQAGLIKEWLQMVGDVEDPGSLSDRMYYAYYDLMINSETGKFKPELEKLFPSPGKDPNY